MSRIDPISYNGDDFLNKCHYKDGYAKHFENLVTFLLQWTEPLLLASLCFILNFVLPLLFLLNPTESKSKVSRLYNVSRLTILTFFHRVCYVYLIVFPISVFVNQHPSCLDAYADMQAFFQLYYCPNVRFSSLLITLFFLSSLFSTKGIFWSVAFFLIGVILSLHYVFVGVLSILQAIITFCLCYCLHFYAQRVKFVWCIIEDMVLMFVSVVMIVFKRSLLKDSELFRGIFISAATFLVIDLYSLLRFIFTRMGFVSIGRPIDLEYETDTKSNTYFNILNPEEEGVFLERLKGDLFDSVIDVIIYFIGLIIRHALAGRINSDFYGLV